MRGYALEHGGRHERAVEEGGVCGGWRGHCAVLTGGHWQKSGDGADGAEVGAALVRDDVEECERMKCIALYQNTRSSQMMLSRHDKLILATALAGSHNRLPRCVPSTTHT